MVAASSSCPSGDTAGYWAPALYRNGVKVNPAGSYGSNYTRQQIYYRDNNVSSTTHITAFPSNFKMIFGAHDATTLVEANAAGAKLGSEIYWGCSDNSETSKWTVPGNCATGIVTLHLQF